jgi:RNA polymerase sigma factor for flagellar operon FliA
MPSTEMTRRQRNLVESNLALVEHIVNRLVGHLPRKLQRDDLVQVGCLGLVEAAQRFDEERGIAFSTFAGRRLEGSIRDAIRREDWMPRATRSRAAELARLEDTMQAESGERPTRERLAEAAGIGVPEVTKVRGAVRRADVQSMNRPMVAGDGQAATLEDFMSRDDDDSPEDGIEQRELLAMVRVGINLLPERQRIVMIAYFLEGRPMDEIASFLGVTQSRISQIRDEAAQMLRYGIEAQFEEKQLDVETRAERRKAEFAQSIASALPGLAHLDDAVIDLTLDMLDLTNSPIGVS